MYVDIFSMYKLHESKEGIMRLQSEVVQKCETVETFLQRSQMKLDQISRLISAIEPLYESLTNDLSAIENEIESLSA